MSAIQILYFVVGIGSAMISLAVVLYGHRIMNAVNEARSTREEIKDHISELVGSLRSDVQDLELLLEHRCTHLESRTDALERDIKHLRQQSR